MAIVAVCRLTILKRMPATPLTLLVAHQVREQVNVQVKRSGKMKTWGGSRTQRANILNFHIVFYQNSTCPSPETDFTPESRAEALPPSKYGRMQARVERDSCVS